jgi:aminopeptidase N
MSKASGRVLLPPTINPTHYSLSLKPDLSSFTFSGVTTIHLQTTTDVTGNEIKMHAKELCFATASYVIEGGTDKKEAIEIRDNKKETTVTFVFEEDIPKGASLIMTIEYSVRFLDLCVFN